MMSTLSPIENVLSPHQVNLEVSFLGVKTNVRIDIPDLREAPRRAWGDWGPMYAVQLDPSQAIVAEVTASSGTHQIPIDTSELKVTSPMVAAVRAETPLCVSLPVVSDGIELEIYYDRDGRPTRVDVAELATDRPLRPVAGRLRVC